MDHPSPDLDRDPVQTQGPLVGGYSKSPSKRRKLDEKIARMRRQVADEELKRQEQREDPDEQLVNEAR
jgi:hypothetical protein